MTPLLLPAAFVLTAAIGWSIHGWASAQRVRFRVADTLCPVRPADAAPAGAIAAVPPVAIIAGAAGTAVAVVAVGPAALAVAALGLATTPALARRRRHRRALARRRSQLPLALEELAVALRSGSSLPVALGEAGRATPDPLGPELEALALGAGRGQPMAVVLDDWTRCHDDRGTRLAATALILANAVGVASARAVHGVAATLRERLELSAERRALASLARTSGLVLLAAPLLFALLLGVSDGAAGHFLLRSQAGWACLALGIGLDGLGAWWMARLTRGEQP
jgi:tight adherence protein B